MDRDLKLLVKIFAKRVEEYFGPLLLGKIIEGRGEITEGYFEETYIYIEDMSYIMQRFAPEKKEEDLGLKEYFDQRVKGQKIKSIKFDSTFRIDEVALFCILENGESIELEMGYDAFTERFYNSYNRLGVLLTKEEKQNFLVLKHIYKIVENVGKGMGLTYERKKEAYRKILKILNFNYTFDYEISDFYKLEKIASLFKQDEIGPIETLAEIERIIYI